MAGIYIHIPFCKQACTYCDFHFSTSLALRTNMVNSICQEIELKKEEWDDLAYESIYFGGGTPSLLTAEELNAILRLLFRHFRFKDSIELTLEANPDDINTINVLEWKMAGINRLSIGLQSLRNDELIFMNRSHTAEESLTAVDISLSSGIDDINVDFIYGSHLKTNKQWEFELDWLQKSGANHLSAYALTVESKTALAANIKKGIVPNTKDAHQAEQFMILNEFAEQSGWDFYEISNLSKPGHAAVHNSNYWRNKPYLGLGPSAHSYRNNSRFYNVANNAKYIKEITQSKIPQTIEKLDLKDISNETILTQLRLAEGLPINNILKNHPNWLIENTSELENMRTKGWLTIDSDRVKLLAKGRLMADHISAELFIDE